MDYFGSTNKTLDRQLIEFQNFELQIIAQDRIDDLSPSVKSMEATQIVLEMLIELGDHIKKNGKSPKAEKSTKRLLKLFDLISSLNTLTGDLNTLKLNNKSMYAEWLKMKKDNAGLQRQLDNIIAAENF